MRPVQEFHVNDRVQMRKPHPCGSAEWEIYRVGADIGIRCLGCDRRVMMKRSDFVKRIKHVLPRPTTAAESNPLAE
jgi:hypothetical protein